MENNIKTKICSNPDCPHKGEPQPITNFYRDACKNDGYRHDCKDCNKAKCKKYRAANKEDLAKKKREWNEALALYESYYEKLKKYNECQRDPSDNALLQVKCTYCGRWFNPTNAMVLHRLGGIKGTRHSKSDANFYCSDSCKEACPVFGQKFYPKDFQNNSPREVQPELRKMVLERDNWICQKCGKSKEEFLELELHCHHIFPLNEDPICSADIDNCETLCKECHRWIHKNVPGCGNYELRCSN